MACFRGQIGPLSASNKSVKEPIMRDERSRVGCPTARGQSQSSCPDPSLTAANWDAGTAMERLPVRGHDYVTICSIAQKLGQVRAETVDLNSDLSK